MSTNLHTISSSGSNAGYLIKYDRNGMYQWAVGLDGPNDDRCIAVTVDSKDNVIVIGQAGVCTTILSIQNPGRTPPDCQGIGAFITKYSTSGTFLWSAFVDGLLDDTPQSITTDRLDNIYVSGVSSSPSISLHDGRSRLFGSVDLSVGYSEWIFKLTANGSVFGNDAPSLSNTAGNGFTLPGRASNTFISTSTHVVSSTHFVDTGSRPVDSESSSTLVYGAVGGAVGVFILSIVIIIVCLTVLESHREKPRLMEGLRIRLQRQQP